jgi:hypothetical protein
MGNRNGGIMVAKALLKLIGALGKSRKRRTSKHSAIAMPVAPASNLGSLVLAHTRGFNQDVVGEGHRQSSFLQIMGPKTPEGFDAIVQAQLIFDDGNVHDSNAVGVLLERYHVGYLPRAEAAAIRSEILAINPKEMPVVCKAKVVGGWKRVDGDEGSFGIRLSLARPLRVAK